MKEDYEVKLVDKEFDENKLYRGLFRSNATIEEMRDHMESCIPESHRKYVSFTMQPKMKNFIHGGMQWEYQLPDKD